MGNNLVLQNRWKIEKKGIRYYGIRKAPFTTKNFIKLKKKELNALKHIAETPLSNKLLKNKRIKLLINQEILIDPSKLRITPKSFEEAVFCKKCIANDFMLTGIEFNEEGLCPMCANSNKDEKITAILPIQNIIKPSKKSRFDVAVFYTGGKDSTYLLYYFSKVLNLRVLALTWEIPFMSDNAKKSIEAAKRKLKNVEFVNRMISPNDFMLFNKELIRRQNNTCSCPSLAYAVFFQDLVMERVPYMVAGNEPVQMKALYYNNLAPRIAYRFSKMKLIHFFMNVGRVLTLKKPLKKGQFELLLLIKQLAYGDGLIKRMSNYRSIPVENVVASLDKMPNLKRNLKKTIRYANRRGAIPQLIHVDLNTISPGGVYNWQDLRDVLIKETGWVAPESANKNLHTSCRVEKAKDYSQFIAFYNMESPVMSYSAIEISLASASKNLTREQAISELKNHLGITLDQPQEHKIMVGCDGCPID